MSKIVHFEIPVDDSERASAFYSTVLDWEISGFGEEPYWLVKAGDDGESGANGALIGRGDIHQNPVLIVGVTDLTGTLRRVEQAGGQVLQDRMEIPSVGWSAYIRDPEGNTIGLFETAPAAG
jgi:hypothetical protein